MRVESGVTHQDLAFVTPAPEVPGQHPRHARIALPEPVRAKLERLERAAVGARACVADLGARIDTERARLWALEQERKSWGLFPRVSQSDLEQHRAQEAQVTAELERLTRERDELQTRVQTLGAVVDTARRYLGVQE